MDFSSKMDKYINFIISEIMLLIEFVLIFKPASYFLNNPALSISDANLYKKATSLLLAIQYYNEIYVTGGVNITQTQFEVLKSIGDQTDCVPEEDRCYNKLNSCSKDMKYVMI